MCCFPFFAQYYNEWSVLHMSESEINLVNGTLVLVTLWLPQELRSGLGNIWKFAYLAL